MFFFVFLIGDVPPDELQCIYSEDVVRIFKAVGLNAESRRSDGVECELAEHLLGLEDLPRHGGSPEKRLDVCSALVNVRHH